MKTTILAAVAATVLGMVGGTAWTVVAHEPAPVPTDSAAVADANVEPATDSAAATAAARPPEAQSVAPAETEESGHMDPASHSAAHGGDQTGPSADAAAPAPTRMERAATPQPAVAGAETETESGADQLARIFTAMQPRDAARVLGQLTDAEVREILTRMGARQAAAVLSNMAPERAAILSRTVLSGEGGAP